jgi:ParB-like chromosome segregation protein Spo0J
MSAPISKTVGDKIPSIELRDIDKLIPYVRNARKHSNDEIDEVKRAIEEWGWTSPILVDGDNTIIAGHRRTLAASRIYKAGGSINLSDGRTLPERMVPVIVAKNWTEDQKTAYILADNKLAENASWDAQLLNFELSRLDDAGFDLSLAGFEGYDPPEEPEGKDPAREVNVTDTEELDTRFWISLRGPMADQARTLDAIKKALGAPGEVEIEIGLIS